MPVARGIPYWPTGYTRRRNAAVRPHSAKVGRPDAQAGKPAFEQHGVPIGTCFQISSPPAREVLGDLGDLRQEASAQLRRALLSAGRVRRPMSSTRRREDAQLASPDALARDATQLHVGDTLEALSPIDHVEPSESSQPTALFDAVPDFGDEEEALLAEAVAVHSALQEATVAHTSPDAAPDQWDMESDSVLREYMQRAERRLRSNQWISETAPKVEVFVDPYSWQKRQQKKLREEKVDRAVLDKLENKPDTGFQEYVNARHRRDAYDICTGLPYTGQHKWLAEQSKEAPSTPSRRGSATERVDDLRACFGGLFKKTKEEKHEMEKVVPAVPVGTRNPVRDSIFTHRRTVLAARRFNEERQSVTEPETQHSKFSESFDSEAPRHRHVVIDSDVGSPILFSRTTTKNTNSDDTTSDACDS